MLSTIVWNGAGDGTSFASGANWVGGVAPGASDTAMIDVANSVTITLPAGGVTVNTIEQNGGSLIAPSGAINEQIPMSLVDVSFNDEGASNLSAMLDNSTLTLGVNSGAASFSLRQGCTLVGQIAANQSVTLLGEPGAGNSTSLTVAGGTSNLGTITFGGIIDVGFPIPSDSLIVTGGTNYTNAGKIVDTTNLVGILNGGFVNPGTIDLSGTSPLELSSGSTLTNQSGGVINAAGTLDDSTGSFVNQGSLFVQTATTGAPSLAITGAYTQTSTGVLGIGIGGTTAGTQYGQLSVAGTATLAGALDVGLANGFLASNGNSFQVLTFGSASGSFASYNGTTLTNGLALQPSQTATHLTLTAVQLPGADLAVTATAQPGTVLLGGNVTYTVTVTNNGPDTAQGVAVSDALPSGASVVSIHASSGTTATSGNIVTLDLLTMANAATATLTIVLKTAATGTETDTATVSDTSPNDPYLTNNTAMVSVAVKAQPAVSLITSTTFAARGKPVTLTAQVIVPAGFVPATQTVTFFDGTTSLGTMTLNDSGLASIVVSTLALGTHSLTVSYSGDSNYAATTSTASILRIGTVAGDFDGDGKSDIAIYDNSTATVFVIKSAGGTVVQPFGNPTHVNIPVSGDFDGDGKADYAIYDQTAAYYFVEESGGGTIAMPFGNPSHVNVPVAGDFDGDGKTDIAIYDQTAAIVYVLKSAGGSIALQFGNPAHLNIPVAGDFDGDGKTDIAIYDETSATFFALPSGGGQGIVKQFGNPSHVNIPVAGDYDGDGKTDLAIYDKTSATYYVQESGGGSIVDQFGNPADVNIPIALDFDGDGRSDITIYDQTTAEYYSNESGGGSLTLQFGTKKHATSPI